MKCLLYGIIIFSVFTAGGMAQAYFGDLFRTEPWRFWVTIAATAVVVSFGGVILLSSKSPLS